MIDCFKVKYKFKKLLYYKNDNRNGKTMLK